MERNPAYINEKFESSHVYEQRTRTIFRPKYNTVLQKRFTYRKASLGIPDLQVSVLHLLS